MWTSVDHASVQHTSSAREVCSARGWTVWPPGDRSDSQTQVMSPSFASMSHTPINHPTRNMSFQQEYDATITASEDFHLPRHSGASSSTQHLAATRVATLMILGSSGTGLTKVSVES